MSVSLYFVSDYKKKLCVTITKQIAKTCCSIKDNDREKCMILLDKYTKFCTPYK